MLKFYSKYKNQYVGILDTNKPMEDQYEYYFFIKYGKKSNGKLAKPTNIWR